MKCVVTVKTNNWLVCIHFTHWLSHKLILGKVPGPKRHSPVEDSIDPVLSLLPSGHLSQILSIHFGGSF